MFKFIRRHKTRQYFEFVMDIIYNTASKYGLLITDLNPRNKYSAEMTICKPSDMRIGMILVVSIKDGDTILIGNTYSCSLGKDSVATLNKFSRQIVIPYNIIRDKNFDLELEFYKSLKRDIERMMDLESLSHLI